MNRHYANGFRRTFINDLNDVEPQLQAYDPHLYIMYNPDEDEHLVMDGMLELAIMRIPQIGFPELNSKVVEHVKRISAKTGFQATKLVDENEALIQKEFDRKQEDLSYNFAKDTEKHVRQLA
jgi:hypothetical protein